MTSCAYVQSEKTDMIEHCESELLATVLVNTATVVRMPDLPKTICPLFLI